MRHSFTRPINLRPDDLLGQLSLWLVQRQVCRSVIFQRRPSRQHPFHVRRRVEHTAHELSGRSLLSTALSVRSLATSLLMGTGAGVLTPPYMKCELLAV